jgi:alpha-amylase/alpha-mannosidase (GH57 family)
MMGRYVCVHGHFYQPPRENPWLERVEMEEGAAPYHDWNQRITAECYAPNAASRIMDSQDMILAIVNNYSLLSFNFGPTLLSWMERESPEVYRSILEADIKSRSYFSGHGSALAQPYNHMIMPLANQKDKKTQVKWGIRDFSARFNRKPQGMWLPETAVDTETLETLAEEEIEFTILAPHQASSYRGLGAGEWIDVNEGNIDTRVPYLCRLPSGRSMAIFFYNQQISNNVAFSRLLSNGEEMADTIVNAFSDDAPGDQLVHIATDGETYGHHHKFGEMALSYCLHSIRERGLAALTNYGAYLAHCPPAFEVRIRDNTSWSCYHGIERWRDDCGCSIGGGVYQVWRKPLREAMDWLRNSLSQIYEAEASKYLREPWSARDEYIHAILDRSRGNVEAFLTRNSRRALSQEEKTTVLMLLEMQRNAMLMYTSCGWYFDDISGIEALQVMRYAARAMQLAKEVNGVDLEQGFLSILRSARSSKGDMANGAELYLARIKPAVADLMKVGIHYAISSLFNSHEGKITGLYSYTVKDEVFLHTKAGKSTLLIGRSKITSDLTWESQIASYAVLWLGGNGIFGGAEADMPLDQFHSARDDIQRALENGDIPQAMASIAERFKSPACAPCTLKDLFKDKQVEIIERTLQSPIDKALGCYSQVFHDSRSSLEALASLSVKPPLELKIASDVVLTKEIAYLLSMAKVDFGRLEHVAEDIKNLGMDAGKELIALEAQKRIESDVDALTANLKDAKGFENLERLLSLLFRMDLPINLWRAQNKWYYLVGLLKSESGNADTRAQKYVWSGPMLRISEYLRVRV